MVSFILFESEMIQRAVSDYVTLCVILLLGKTAAVHKIWCAQWPLHDAVRGIVTSNNTDILERFLGKEKFVRTFMRIKRPYIVSDDQKSCLLAPVRKGKVLLHRTIKYCEVRKHAVSMLFNNCFEPVFWKGGVFRDVTVQNEVFRIGEGIPAQDLIS